MMMQTIPFSEIQWSLLSEGDPFPLCGRHQFCLYQQIPFHIPNCLCVYFSSGFSLEPVLNAHWFPH